MTERRRGLGRGLGALIPTAPEGDRPSDVFFPRAEPATAPIPEQAPDHASGVDEDVSRETSTPRTTDNERFTGNASADGADEPALAPVPGATFAEIDVASIRPNPRQPRQVFDEDELAELAHSIAAIGVLQPVVVRRISEGDESSGHKQDAYGAAADATASETTESVVRYELVMGERRWRASQEAGAGTIPAIIREVGESDLLRDALLENLHRSQLNPLEEAAAYQQLLEDFGCTQEELSGRIGRSRPQIGNTLRLLKLPPLVQRRLASGVISAGHARALLGLEDASSMERLAQRIVSEGLSVRSVEEIVTLGGDDQGNATPRRARAPKAKDPELESIADGLADQLDTRVTIDMGKRKGKLSVEFATREDLDRILAALGNSPTSN